MKINFDVAMKDMEGEEIKNGEKVLTLKNVAVNALMATFEDEKNLSGDEKLTRYVLACKVRGGGECDLPVSDVATIKTLIGKAYGTLIVGQAWELLEGKG